MSKSATRDTVRPAPPRITLTVEEACEALGVSWDTWRAHIEPDVRLIRLGRRKLVPVAELEHWADRHAARTLAEEPLR